MQKKTIDTILVLSDVMKAVLPSFSKSIPYRQAWLKKRRLFSCHYRVFLAETRLFFLVTEMKKQGIAGMPARAGEVSNTAGKYISGYFAEF